MSGWSVTSSLTQSVVAGELICEARSGRQARPVAWQQLCSNTVEHPAYHLETHGSPDWAEAEGRPSARSRARHPHSGCRGPLGGLPVQQARGRREASVRAGHQMGQMHTRRLFLRPVCGRSELPPTTATRDQVANPPRAPTPDLPCPRAKCCGVKVRGAAVPRRLESVCRDSQGQSDKGGYRTRVAGHDSHLPYQGDSEGLYVKSSRRPCEEEKNCRTAAGRAIFTEDEMETHTLFMARAGARPRSSRGMVSSLRTAVVWALAPTSPAQVRIAAAEYAGTEQRHLIPSVYPVRTDKASKFASNCSRHGGDAGAVVEVCITFTRAKYVSYDDHTWIAEGY